jgi:SAM-dependent methyltransferase
MGKGMTNPAPIVFDHALLLKRRERAAPRYGEASYLKQRAVDDLVERLAIIQREFPSAIELGSHGNWLRDALTAEAMLGSKIGALIQTDPAPTFHPGPNPPSWETLPVGAGSIDLIVSALSLHWVNDLPGLFAQARLALRPDGLFLVTFLGGRTLQELREVLLEAEVAEHGGAGSRVSPFADSQDAARLLQRAGFALPVADSDVVTVRFDSLFGLLRDLQTMGETAAFASRPAKPLTRTIIARAASLYQERFSDPDGRVRATFELVTVTGWAPHESQQKPLRPGSAIMRLADALSTKEISTGQKAGGGG